MRRSARPILGVDIDNVLAQSDMRLRAMIREMFGIRLEEHQMTRYEYMTYGVTEEPGPNGSQKPTQAPILVGSPSTPRA